MKTSSQFAAGPSAPDFAERVRLNQQRIAAKLKPRCDVIILSFALGLLFASALVGQTGQFQGSVPAGSASATPLALKLDDAVQRGLQTNLGLLVRDTTSR